MRQRADMLTIEPMAKRFWADQGTRDTDRDGLSDDFERDVLGTDPTKADTDGDKLNDLRELDFGANPMLRDSDGDGMDDFREVIVGTNPQDRDTDRDGADDRTEVRQGTPTIPDADGDGTPDWLERNDADGDRLTDLEERWLGTKVDEADSDWDAVDDWWELATGQEARTREDLFRRRHPGIIDEDREQEYQRNMRPQTDPSGSTWGAGLEDSSAVDVAAHIEYEEPAATLSQPELESDNSPSADELV